MLAIEPYIRRQELLSYLKIAGYNAGIVEERGKNIPDHVKRRYTLMKNDIKNFRNILKRDKNIILFSKPHDIDTLRFSILESDIKAISIDDSNIRIFRKAMLNLININNKILEISLKSSSFVINRAISWGYRWSFPMIFSSYANEFNELWPVLSKIDYLILHGASETMAYRWVLIEPFKLFLKDE
ncbi:hypothetical protein [Sulfuracidifex tepidarius]|uniref:RNase P subunit p30 n=1 Tax=Sulfuracidifex tepidarius TaxID=1294262 RepID=A0A510DW22_9CREN|nr:hypothetical protein [Sulfuracidifex tepidarius]BBG24421.1 hypothetical protein IC006_1733 [Sulfuracidifex tepidarius]BBG27179.1 hypothetical protein IC007_1711 [Sulfuracidifex tepidarius]